MGKIADISQHISPINWDLARKELDFVIFRASAGGDYKDTKYLKYTKACNLPYGAYHYVKAGTAEEAKKEAIFFVKCANEAEKKPLFYIADIEYEAQNEKTTEPVCVAFLEELRRLGCKKIGMYINRKYKYAGKAIEMCDIMWIPHWGKNDGNVPGESSKPKYYNDLWQYTSEGALSGVNEPVDLNLLNGDKPLEYFTHEEIIYFTKGSKNDKIKDIQNNLNSVLKINLEVDGIFGSKTEEAIKNFQKQYNLEVNGFYDEKTDEILTKIFSEQKETVVPEKITKQYFTKNSVNVRAGDGTSYEKITHLEKNVPINVVLNKKGEPIISANGWYAIYIMDKICWLSGNYVKENI